MVPYGVRGSSVTQRVSLSVAVVSVAVAVVALSAVLVGGEFLGQYQEWADGLLPEATGQD